MKINADGNMLGRIVALVLIVGGIVGVQRISCGTSMCPVEKTTHSCCTGEEPAKSPMDAMKAAAAPSAPAKTAEASHH